MSEDLLPLASEIRRLIAVAGPMPVAQYMTLCLTHPAHGYYVTRDPFGTAGDFTTAPEISQMFGELVGLWAASVWHAMGAPENVRLIELGPGRGTMMLDALRAAQVVPGFRRAIVLHLVEISPVLQQRQRQTLAALDAPVHWHDSLVDVPAGPAIILANEFFDALPVHQAVKKEDGWHERVIEINGVGNFAFAVAADPLRGFGTLLPRAVRESPPGAIFEWRSDQVGLEIGRRVVQQGGAALVIDYGHVASATGETLQAVGRHNFADVLVAPGAVDLTAHVDFQALADQAESMGARIHGPIEQRELLRRLGIEARAKGLKALTPPDKAAEIDAALARLTADGGTGMGTLFKAIVIADPKLATYPGFDG
jgi:NADH dehydrogenase [ubiquinone] 1 alpha subcomplex assembly factor 7